MRWHLAALVCLPLVALGAIACADQASAPTHGASPGPTETQAVGIVVGDIVLSGRLFGAGNKTIVVLSHMRGNDQTAWFPFARTLADNGYAALTFDFRGHGASAGSQDYDKLDDDLAAVINYLRDTQKYSKIFLVGASMGGTASIVVAQDEDVAAVVALSPPAKFDNQDALQAVRGVTEPKLFIASEEDAPALDFDNLVDAAPEPKEEEVYPGIAHGTDLFDPAKNPDAASVGARILSFLRDRGGP